MALSTPAAPGRTVWTDPGMEERCSRHWSSHWTSTTTATGHSRWCKRSPGAPSCTSTSSPCRNRACRALPDAYELERRAHQVRLGQRFVDDRPRHRCCRWHRRARCPPARSSGGDGDLGQAADELFGVRQRHPRCPAPQPGPGAPDRTQRADGPRPGPPSLVVAIDPRAVDDVTVPAIASWLETFGGPAPRLVEVIGPFDDDQPARRRLDGWHRTSWPPVSVHAERHIVIADDPIAGLDDVAADLPNPVTSPSAPATPTAGCTGTARRSGSSPTPVPGPRRAGPGASH